MKRVLKQEFFDRSTIAVAENLLGKVLVRKWRGKELAYRIIEVEAYDGHHDKASHAHKGKTSRTEVMFGEPGYWYVYLVYGMYWMLNIVTGPEAYPAAILIRGVEGISGPGKLTRELHITQTLNKKPSVKSAGLWIEERGERVPRKDIIRTSRIGISYAKEWRDKPLRFVLKK